jgi:hypothetical protein
MPKVVRSIVTLRVPGAGVLAQPASSAASARATAPGAGSGLFL